MSCSRRRGAHSNLLALKVDRGERMFLRMRIVGRRFVVSRIV